MATAAKIRGTWKISTAAPEPKDLEREVQRRILIGTYALSAGYYDAYYRQAQRNSPPDQNDFVAAFDQVDTIRHP